MRNLFRKKVQISLIISLVILLLPNFIFISSIPFPCEKKSVEDNDILKSKSWDLTGSFIHIDNNWSATKQAFEWCYGNGTFRKPYVIENVTIDCLRHFCGISIRNSSEYFVIRNCIILNSGIYEFGISLSHVNNSKIIDNNCSSNGYGIYLVNCYNNSISNNILTNNTLGLMMGSSDNNTVSNNMVDKNFYGGIGLYICDDNKIIRNNMSYHNFSGLWVVTSDRNTISDNRINNNYMNGLHLESCFNNSINGNRMSNNGKDGILLEDCNNNNISRNFCNQNTMNGIHLKTFVHHDGIRGIYNTLSENEIHFNSNGIKLNYSDHCVIIDNDVRSNNYFGIDLDNSDYTLITRNIINNNYHGVNLINSINNDLLTNTINNNYCGIYFTDSHKNVVFNNTILNSVKCYVENGRCIDNTFEDNICQEILILNEWIILGIILTASAIGLASLFLIINRKKRDESLNE